MYKPHEQRVVDELQELEDKIVKLLRFMNPNNKTYTSLPLTEQRLLNSQYNVMNEYAKILTMRIELFNKK